MFYRVLYIERNPYIWLYLKPNTVTSHHVLEVTSVLHQAQLGVVLHVISGASEYPAVSLPDTICSVCFQYVSCVGFIMVHLILKVTPLKGLGRG
jgi:hypothetical protein